MKVAGVVADMEGRAIPFANVTLHNRKTRNLYGTSTGKYGFFMVKVPEGHCNVAASYVG